MYAYDKDNLCWDTLIGSDLNNESVLGGNDNPESE